MLSRLNIRHPLVWLFSFLLFLGTQAARAQLETYAWTQRVGGTGLTVSASTLALDTFGRTYGLYRVHSATSTTISLRAFDVDGTPLFSKTVLSVATDAEAKQLVVTKQTMTPTIVVSCRYKLPTGKWNTYFAQYDSSGGTQWAHVYDNGSNCYPLGIDVPGDGFVYLAETGNFPSWHLHLEKLTTAGVVVSSHYNTSIVPNAGFQPYHTGKTWIAFGGTPAAPTTTAMFGVFDDLTAGIKFSKTYFDHKTGTNSYHYSVPAYLYNGNILVIENFIVTPDVGSVSTYHVYWSYSLSGVVQWTSATRPGTAAAALTNFSGGSNPVYILHNNLDGNNENVEKLNSNGTVSWSIHTPDAWSGGHIVADSQGFSFGAWDNTVSPTQAHLQRYDSNGVLRGSYLPAGGAIPSMVGDGSNTILGVNGTGTLAGIALTMRYVAGFALLDVVPGSTTLNSNGSTSFKIDFNSAASASGTATIHSTSPLLTFGGMQDSTVNFSSGATNVSVTGNVGAVSTTTPVEVIVTINGVKRAAYLTLTP